MLLRLDTDAAGRWLPVVVEIDGEPGGAELVEALVAAQLVPAAQRAHVRLGRTGEALDTDRSLSSLGLRHGDRILSAPAPTVPGSTQAIVELVVGSGPDIGHVTAIPPDGLAVGRAAALTIDDPGLSREHFRIEWNGDALTIRDLGSRNGTFHAGVRVGGAAVVVDADLPIEAGGSLFRISTASDAEAPPHVTVLSGTALFSRAPRLLPPDAAATAARITAWPSPPSVRR